jgi:Ca2+-binding EF-hand superfamily protein
MRSIKLSGCAGLALGVAGVAFAVPAVAVANNVDARFEAMDTNGDGRISPDEHSATAARMFDRMDANGDGKVTAAEMDAFKQKVLADKGVKPKRDEKKAEMSSAEKIKTIDTNGDGVLTADEHAAGAKAMFDKMDADDDSYLSKSEMRAGHEKYMHKSAQPAK